MDITYNTVELLAVSKEIAKKATTIEQAVASAESSVGRIRNMKSPRLMRDIRQWDKVRKEIKKAVIALRDGAKELDRLAEDNRIINQ